MKLKNVNLNTLLYIVGADNIEAVKPDAVIKTQSGKIRIVFNNSYRSDVEGSPEAETVGQYYLNFSDAKKKQSEVRKMKVSNAYEDVKKSIEIYNTMIEKYFDKPLTSDSEVKKVI